MNVPLISVYHLEPTLNNINSKANVVREKEYSIILIYKLITKFLFLGEIKHYTFSVNLPLYIFYGSLHYLFNWLIDPYNKSLFIQTFWRKDYPSHTLTSGLSWGLLCQLNGNLELLWFTTVIFPLTSKYQGYYIGSG